MWTQAVHGLKDAGLRSRSAGSERWFANYAVRSGLIVSWRRLDPMHAAGWSVSDDLCVQRETNKKAQTVKANWANPTAGRSNIDSVYPYLTAVKLGQKY
ncbi:hypothetical protein T08_10548 [Trichinella sp. T8]|nr:hypothetical protein T08_10548 [Trichinella sp. T8]